MNHDELESLIGHTKNNELDILKSKECHCLFCNGVFPAKEVHDWVSEKGETRAACPRCGAPYVLGDAIYSALPKGTLEEASRRLLSEFEADDLIDYLSSYRDRYEQGLVPQSDQADDLYLACLQALTHDGDPSAALVLAGMWVNGDPADFDPARAYELLTEEAFIDNPVCAAMAGVAALNCGKELRHAKQKAFECFSRASALGYDRGTVLLANAYLDGIGVEKSAYVAFSILSNRFPKMLEDFLFSPKQDDSDFRDRVFCLFIASYTLMSLFYSGRGVEVDHEAALYFGLLALYFGSYVSKDGRPPELDEVERDIKALGKELGFRDENEIRYDEYAFGDTFAYLWRAIDLPFSYEILSEDPSAPRMEIQTDFRFDPLLVDFNTLSVKLGSKLGAVWTFSAKRIAGEKKGDVEWMRLGRDRWTFGNYDAIDGSPVTTLELLMNFEDEA